MEQHNLSTRLSDIPNLIDELDPRETYDYHKVKLYQRQKARTAQGFGVEEGWGESDTPAAELQIWDDAINSFRSRGWKYRGGSFGCDTARGVIAAECHFFEPRRAVANGATEYQAAA
jgi:hypothetical protein